MKLVYFYLLITSALFAQIPFPQDTIVRNDMFNNRQFAVYDLNGKISVTWTGQNGTASNTREIFLARENNNGTFTTSQITTNSVDDGYSSLSVDKNNKLHLGWEARDPGIFQLLYSNNVNGTWLNPIAITTGGANKANPYSKIGPDSVVHFVYYTYVSSVQDYAYYKSFRLKDSVLSPEVQLCASETAGDYEAVLDIDQQGKVHIVVKSGGVFGGPLKYYNNTTGTFVEYNTGITANISVPRIIIDKENNPMIFYRNEDIDRMCVIKKTGSVYSSQVVISPAGQLAAGCQSPAVDDSNYVYITWQSSQSASGKGFYMVYGKNMVFTDTMKIYDVTPEYVTRNSSHVIAKGKGQIALFYAPGGVRNTFVICDIFMKRGNVFGDVPVELTSFTASIINNHTQLRWSTASETNNKGFDIERSYDQTSWTNIGFIKGAGTTLTEKRYQFSDKISNHISWYRLKQMDYDGTVSYSKIVSAENGLPVSFKIEQNFPNPFNPSTIIRYSVPKESLVELSLYDVLGNKITDLVNENKSQGMYEYTLDASSLGLSSGVYFYQLKAENYRAIKKLVFLK